MSEPSVLHVDRIRKVVDDGHHNAFTDLIRFDDHYYLTYRRSPHGHMVFPDSQIVVMQSADGEGWHEVFAFGAADRDVRDPHFLAFRNTLFVYSGAWALPAEGRPTDYNDHLGFGAWTSNGIDWAGPRLLDGTHGYYIWRAAAYDDRAYLWGRRRREFAPLYQTEDEERIEGVLLESDDGLIWRLRAVASGSYGNETAFLFQADGSILGIERRLGDLPARVLRSPPPYDQWAATDLARPIGGPMLARWGQRLLVGGRRSDPASPSRTSLSWLEHDQLLEITDLPSGGDNSYPGFLAHDDTRGLLSYYSSHGGRGASGSASVPNPSAIYLADLHL